MKRLHFCLLILLCMILIGCRNEKIVKEPDPSPTNNELSETAENSTLDEKTVEPLHIQKQAFVRSIGWVNGEEMVYVQFIDGMYQFIRYHIHTGEQSVFYETDKPFVTAEISSSNQWIMIHTAPITSSANIVVIDLSGTVMIEKEIPSYELMIEWNPYDENLVFLTAFNEEWTHELYLLNISTNKMQLMEGAEAFLTWSNEDTWLYQKWNQDEIQLVSPLYEKGFQKDEKMIGESVFQFDKLEEYLLEIIVDENDVHSAHYQFTERANSENPLRFTVPQLDQYSSWLVPFYTIDRHHFFVFTPYKSGPFDAYQDNFQLISWNLKTGEEEVLFENIKNEPLQCTSQGTYCLYGYKGEKLINLKEQEINNFVEMENEVIE
ncbi:hypothetical protein WAK64_02100 [Bacillus spongiae]|uniref:YqgU-like 6-bladed beta-propeller domain-containing protein n=1 Tax=Bacillus spongiae TaxID=2683610 RepID=A0ABU8H978_9BACI